MSRRSLFMLTATVVLLYFSIIVFMLSPLHGERRAFYTNAHPLYRYCKDLRYKPPGPAVALVSYPGSGNTWLRYLLQQVTGIMTGSVYLDYGLRLHGFPAENVTDGTVLVVKTHQAPPYEPNKFQAAILLIRNPRDAILAEYNRLYRGHLGTAPKSAFRKKTHDHHMSDWELHVMKELAAWQILHEQWLTHFEGRVLVVFYEALVHDTRYTLQEALAFLNQTVTEEDIKCALLNKQGIYQRRKKLEGFEPYTDEMYAALKLARSRVVEMVSKYNKQHGFAELPTYNNEMNTQNNDNRNTEYDVKTYHCS